MQGICSSCQSAVTVILNPMLNHTYGDWFEADESSNDYRCEDHYFCGELCQGSLMSPEIILAA